MDCNAAIDRAPEVVNLDRTTSTVNRNFSNARELSTRVIEIGQTETAPFALATPLGHTRDVLDHMARTWRARQMLQPELHWIDAAFHCDLVHEHFIRERVLPHADGPQRSGSHARVLLQ